MPNASWLPLPKTSKDDIILFDFANTNKNILLFFLNNWVNTSVPQSASIANYYLMFDFRFLYILCCTAITSQTQGRMHYHYNEHISDA